MMPWWAWMIQANAYVAAGMIVSAMPDARRGSPYLLYGLALGQMGIALLVRGMGQ